MTPRVLPRPPKSAPMTPKSPGRDRPQTRLSNPTVPHRERSLYHETSRDHTGILNINPPLPHRRTFSFSFGIGELTNFLYLLGVWAELAPCGSALTVPAQTLPGLCGRLLQICTISGEGTLYPFKLPPFSFQISATP